MSSVTKKKEYRGDNRALLGSRGMQPGLEILWSGGGVDFSIHLAPTVVQWLALVGVGCYGYWYYLPTLPPLAKCLEEWWLAVEYAVTPYDSLWGDLASYHSVFAALAISVGAVLFSIFHVREKTED